jgi:cAMP phosphodiesterase
VKLTLIPATVLGSSENYHYCTSAIVNDVIALDAGCIGFYRSAQEQARIRHLFITHTHIDHIASLPIFVENAYEGKTDCVTIHGSADVLDCCQKDLFNNRVWPDFIALSKGERPFLKMARFEAGETMEVEGLKITSVAVNHVVPTNSYILSDANCSVAFISDTGPTEEIWHRLNALPNLKALFLEATFPNSMTWLADLSKHLTPAMFGVELRKLNKPVRSIVVHQKARYQQQVTAEILALKLPQVELARYDVPYVF